MEKETISGYDLALHVLNHEYGGVEALLSLSGKDESCWLELKAGMKLLPADEKKGDKPEDLYWNIAKAVISLANTSGGIVLIGIDDKNHDVVPLRSNDPRHVIEKEGMEAYRRKEIFERIWPNEKKWTSKKETWEITISIPENLVEVRGCQYQGEEIAAILVRPASSCIRIWEKWENHKEEQILIREAGELGKVKSISGFDPMGDYIKSRRIKTTSLASLLEQFRLKSEESSKAGVINRAVEQYYKTFSQEIKKKRQFDLSCFVELDGAGELQEEDDFMAPSAVELGEDDDWLSDSKDEEEKDDDDQNNDDWDEDEEFKDREDNDNNESEASLGLHRSGDLLSLMKEIPRLIVLGEPGGGKTTTLLRFCTLFSNAEVSPDTSSTLAVFIPMGQWLKGGSISILLTSLTGLSTEQWVFLIRQGRLRLVIDAFNECPDQYKEAALMDLQAFLRQYPDVPVVISARSDAELASLHLPRFSVQPMDQEHQRQYLVRYLKDEEVANNLLSRLTAMSGGSALAANPMLLRLIVEVFKVNHTIPHGRAGLYHQWLSQWYRREFSKAKLAGVPLPWDFDEALAILSRLALNGRLQGYRDIPLDFARETLQEYGPDCIEKLCQGPVVTIDKAFIRFRHETFQEYLCAEQLVKKPELLSQDNKIDYTQWVMVLAYASELCWPLPDTLWRLAWRINPWLGIALTDETRARAITDEVNRDVRKEYQGRTLKFEFEDNNSIRHIFYDVLRGTGFEVSHVFQNKVWKKLSLFSEYIEYILLTNEEIKKRWILFELWQLSDYRLFYNFNIEKRLIVLRYRCKAENTTVFHLLKEYQQLSFIPIDLKTKISTITSPVIKAKCLISRIPLFISNTLFLGFATKEDFAGKIQQWIDGAATPEPARQLIQLGLATREDFTGKIQQWIDGAATPEPARQLIKLGLATRDVFAGKIRQWIDGAATPERARQLIRLGFVTKDDFSDRIPQWVNDAITPLRSGRLINLGFATREDFADKIQQWVNDDILPEQAVKLIKLGLATKDDFAEKIQKWINGARTPKKTRQLIQLGLATREDFTGKIPQLIDGAATPKQARQLINLGFATRDDFAGKIRQWIDGAATPEQAGQLIKLGFATREDLSGKIQQLIDGAATPEQARQLIQLGLVTKDDFSDRIPQWVNDAIIPLCSGRLINLGFATREDFADKIQQWVNDVILPEQAVKLIKLGLATKDDFAEKIQKWINGARTPKKTMRLIQLGLATKDDFAEKIQKWINGARTPKKARLLINYGLATRENFIDKITHVRGESLQGIDVTKTIGEIEVEMKKDVDLNAVRQYFREMLTDEKMVTIIREELKGKKWQMEVCYSTDKISLFEHNAFPDNVFCYNPNLHSIPKVGSIWSVEVTVSFNKTKQCYGFVVANAEMLSASSKGGERVEQAEDEASNSISEINQPNNKPADDKLPFAQPVAAITSVEILQASSETSVDNKLAGDELPSVNPVAVPTSVESLPVPSGNGQLANPIEKQVFAKVCQTLQRMLCARNESAFLSICPTNWGISFEFCRIYNKELKLLMSLSQSLANPGKKNQDKKKEKLSSLKQLLNSHQEFQGIYSDLELLLKQADEKLPSIMPLTVPTSAESLPVPSGNGQIANPIEKQDFGKVCQMLQWMQSANNEKLFLSILPANWEISFEFKTSHKNEWDLLISLLSSLANPGKKSQEKNKEKLSSLEQLLNSCQEFRCIYSTLESSLKQAGEKLSSATPVAETKPPKSSPTPMEGSKKKKTTGDKLSPVKPPRKPKPPKDQPSVLSGLDYAPGVDITKGGSTGLIAKEFSKNSSHIRIYIDEAWPGLQSSEYNDIGVISGIVWDGNEPDYSILPFVPTHLRYSPNRFQDALTRLLDCSKAFPFIFPIFKQNVTEKDYPELLRIALITLLGWVLPQNGQACEVDIFCEGITSSRMIPGKNYAEEFVGVCNALNLTAGRMQRWRICQFISLKPEDKSFEYVPYGDALGYLTIPNEKAQYWENVFSSKKLPGYIPLTKKLLRQLQMLDSDLSVSYAEELFEFAKDYNKTKLFFYILEQTLQKATSNSSFRDALFDKLERMFEDKQRDIPLLNHLCGELTKAFPLESFDGYPRQRLIRLLVELQAANHGGTPEKAADCVNQYIQQRASLLSENRELCVYTDMNLVVHYNDMMDFSKGALFCRQWENEPVFQYLTAYNRGIILSSIGQSYVFEGEYQRAHDYFIRALQLFSEHPHLADEADQTAVYRALNILDARNYQEAIQLAEGVWGCSFPDAIGKYASNLEKPFHHHLLVKNLFLNHEANAYISAYLECRAKWQNLPQHPWELIELYRILLLHKEYPLEAKERAEGLWALYAQIGNGGTLTLLEAFARCVLFIECGYAECKESIPQMLSRVQEKLPSAVNICQKIQLSLERKLSLKDVWSILPFNYK